MNLENDNRSDQVYLTSKRLAFIGLIATLITSMLAFYYFLESQKSRKLTYYIHPVITTVIDSVRSTNLEVFYKGKEIKSSISAVQIAIWNRGDLAIKMEDILQDIIIKMENGSQILEATIRRTTRDVINLQLDSKEIQSGRLRVQWKILEESDGGMIQITYVGTPQTIIEIEGTILGQGDIEHLEYQGKLQDPMEQYKKQKSRNKVNGFLFFGLFVIYSGLYFLFFRMKLKPNLNLRKRSKRILYIGIGLKYAFPIMILTLFALSFYFLIYKNTPSPPFGF